MALENAEQPESSEVPVVEEVVADASVVPTPSVEPELVTEEPSKGDPPPKKEVGPALIREIAEQREKRRAVERELAQLRTQLEAVKKPQDGQPVPTFSREDFERAVKQEAGRMAYLAHVNGVTEKGHREFGASEFNGAAQRFVDSVGVEARDSLVNDIMDIAGDRAHRIIYELSNDPERSIFIRDMSPAKRAITIHEMVQMAETPVEAKSPLSTPAPKTVSKAPAPAPRIQTTTQTEKPKGWWWSDKTSDEDFNKNFFESLKDRRGMRR